MSDAREALVALIRGEYDKHSVSRYPTEGALADAILAAGWTPPGERVRPSVEDVARAIVPSAAEHHERGYPSSEYDDALAAAPRVLALFPGRTEAEVKADMLDRLLDRLVHSAGGGDFDLPIRTVDWIRSQPEYIVRYPSSAHIEGGGDRG